MSHGQRLLALWRQVAHLPGGQWLFARLLARQVPYTGTVHPRIVELRPGYARATMRDRRGVRNHLDSIHAVALVNLGEVVGGLAMLTGLGSELRGIVTGLSIQYTKKARGRLTAEATVPPMDVTENVERRILSTIRDEGGDVVAEMTVIWRVGPRRK
jgi:acyl-coenzyme A thioesterase PaaI-like protein